MSTPDYKFQTNQLQYLVLLLFFFSTISCYVLKKSQLEISTQDGTVKRLLDFKREIIDIQRFSFSFQIILLNNFQYFVVVVVVMFNWYQFTNSFCIPMGNTEIWKEYRIRQIIVTHPKIRYKKVGYFYYSYFNQILKCNNHFF